MGAARDNGRRIDFARINRIALNSAEVILERWLPSGRREGCEWVSLNPRRSDRHLGSFKVNYKTGAWADFAIGERGSDLISLAAYLGDLSQAQAALQLARMMGIEPHER